MQAFFTETLQADSAATHFGAWPHEGPAQQAHRWRQAPIVPWGTQQPFENLYPRKVESLYYTNAYFRRITDDKAEQIKGEGLLPDGPQAAACRAWLQDVGIGDQLLEAAAYDLALFNGMALQVVWNRARTRVASVHPQRLAQVRVGKPNPEGQVLRYYISSDWAALDRHGRPRNTAHKSARMLEVPAYDPQQPQPRQLLWAAKYSPVTDYYPLPDAESVFEELTLGTEVVAYQRKYVENGMASSAVLYVPFVPEDTLPGQPLSEADRRRMDERRRMIADDLVGNMRAGQIALVWYNPTTQDRNGNPVGVPRFEKPIEERNDLKFIEVQRESRQSFLTGLGVVAPELYGIPSAGGFSSQADMLLTANELSYNKIIQPKQHVLLRALRQLARDAGFDNPQLGIANPLPVSHRLTPDMVRQGLFTANEFREAYGYPPLGN